MKKMFIGTAVVAVSLIASCNKATMSASAADPIQSTAKKTSETPIVATYDGKEITLQELDDSISQDLHNLRRQKLESMIVETLVEKEAKKQGKSGDEYIQSIANAADVSDTELRKLYEENKQAVGNRSFEDVKSKLAFGQKQKAVINHIEDLKKKANVHIQLPTPRISVEAIGPSKGPADAPITIVEFSDFQCPYCSKASNVVNQVLSAYSGKIRLVFRDFPLQFHSNAAKAAEAGLCAESQGKFWKMHDWMFANQGKLSVEELKKGASSLGIDSTKFNECLDSGENAKKVQESMQVATKAGVRGTPAFFVNGVQLSGNQPFEKFKEVIDEELRSQAATN